VAAILTRLLAKNPEDRYQTPGELAAALAPFASADATGWASSMPASSAFVDEMATPEAASPSGADLDDEVEPPGDASAMAGTLPTEFSPTPVSTRVFLPSPSRLSKVIQKEQRSRATVAVLVAIGVVGAVVALLSMVGLILSRF
jgi:hypothetical protein